MGDALKFETCCGCIELKTGCLIIGYIQLVVEIIYSILLLVGFVAGGVAVASDEEDVRVVGVFLLAVFAISFIVLLLLLAFTITLLVGVHKTKRGHVKAYLVFAYISIVLGIIGFCASFAQPPPVSNIVSNVISLLVFIYFTLVIRSYHGRMADMRTGPVVANAFKA